MNHINKVCFAYPVMYQDGMTKEESCIPSPLFTNIDYGTKHAMLVNVGLLITLKSKIHINVTVSHVSEDGKDEPSDGEGKFENLKTSILHDGQAITLTSLFLPSVLFEKSGEYVIRVNLFGSDCEGKKIDKPIDSYRSYFYVLLKDCD